MSGIYRKKVERLTEALNNPEDRNEAAKSIRALVEKMTLRPGPNHGETDATLHGELGTILGWIEAQAIWKDSETRNSRTFRYRSVGIGGCGDTQHPILAADRTADSEAGCMNRASPSPVLVWTELGETAT